MQEYFLRAQGANYKKFTNVLQKYGKNALYFREKYSRIKPGNGGEEMKNGYRLQEVLSDVDDLIFEDTVVVTVSER